MDSFQDQLEKPATECKTILNSAAARDKGGGGGDKWNSTTCKTPVKSPQSMYQYQAFYRLVAIPVNQQPTVLMHLRHNLLA